MSPEGTAAVRELAGLVNDETVTAMLELCAKCIDHQRAENERMRTALERIRDRINDMPRNPRNDYADGEKAGIQWASDHAEDALNQQSSPPGEAK